MIEIPGLTEEEIIQVIHKVALNHKNKTFDIHNEEDIQQKVWEIALSKLDRFNAAKMKTDNKAKALEHWLNTLIHNRLVNFYRDEYLVKQKPLKSDKSDYELSLRISLKHPLPIDFAFSSTYEDYESNVECLDYWNLILDNLDHECKDVLDCILSGEMVNSYYKKKLNEKIEEILDEKGSTDRI